MKLTRRNTMGDSGLSPISDLVRPWSGYIYCELGSDKLYRVVIGFMGWYLVKRYKSTSYEKDTSK